MSARGWKSGGQFCAANGCTNCRGNNPEFSFFGFPKDEERSKRWVINMQRQDLLKRDSQYLQRNCVVCSNHFEDCMFMNVHEKKSLTKMAVPTLFSIPNPPHQVGMKRKLRKLRKLPMDRTVKSGRKSVLALEYIAKQSSHAKGLLSTTAPCTMASANENVSISSAETSTSSIRSYNSKSKASCCVPLCKKIGYALEDQRHVTFHKLPLENIERMKRWIVLIRRDPGPLFKPNKYTKICSRHFTETDFVLTRGGRRFLKSKAEPSIFQWSKDKQAPREMKQSDRQIAAMMSAPMMPLDGCDDDDDEGVVVVEGASNEEDLERLIESRLQELGFDDDVEREVTRLQSTVARTERRYREVKRIFHDCQDVMDKFHRDMDREPVPSEDSEVIGSDSDDDVQFIQTTFEPQRIGGRGPVGLGPGGRTLGGGGGLEIHPLAPPPPGSRRMVNPRSIHYMQPSGSLSGSLVQTMQAPSRPMPPPPMKQIDLALGMKLYGRKFNDIWYKGTLIDIQNKDRLRPEWKYKVKFDGKGMKVLGGKFIAYHDNPMYTMPVGSRVIALYRDEDQQSSNAYYAGIVAEPPSVRNNHRYLIFFDDGYAQYSTLKELHKVYEQSRNVWEDIHPDSAEFIRGYLQQYPERPMVRLQRGQVVKTEWNGQWWVARVHEVDASLVKMYFEADNRVEWIYRGSTRLEPLYTELANAEASKKSGKGRRHNLNVKSYRKPVVEYLRGVDEGVRRLLQAGVLPSPEMEVAPIDVKVPTVESGKRRSVARKSTNARSTARPPLAENVVIFDGTRVQYFTDKKTQSPGKSTARDSERGRVEGPEFGDDVHGTLRDLDRGLGTRDRKSYECHSCGPKCLKNPEEPDPVTLKGNNPLFIPQLCGWERQICKQKNTGKRVVMYRAPCARRLRNALEVDRYLVLTDSKLTVELFCFDPVLHTDMEFTHVKTPFCDIKDLSYGKENVPISCINVIDRQYPDYVEYSTQRIPAKGVSLNLDPDYLVGCDCTDGCRDPKKCRCIQMTREASRANPTGRVYTETGYECRRLNEPLITGIYECNSRCKCDSRCQNRVAQNGLSLRLQVFKTEKRGWGLRCLDDIPAGGFICVYAGQLLTEQGANEDGQQYGDEYLAELDYMEVVERHKEGYESDANEDEGIADGPPSEEDAGARQDDKSDSTYSGERRMKKSSRRRKTDPDEDKVKIILKRDTLSGPEKAWTVKSAAEAKEVSSKCKAQAWLDSLPEDNPIVLSDDDENSGDTQRPSKGASTSSGSRGPSRAGSGAKKSPTEELPDLAVDRKEGVDGKEGADRKEGADKPIKDAGSDVKGEKAEEQKMEQEPESSGAGKKEEKTAKSGDKKEEGAELVITEPTSLNVDNVDSEDSDDVPETKIEDSTFRRTTRSDTSRFRNLPDPKSQKPVSPLKIKLSTMEVQGQEKKGRKERDLAEPGSGRLNTRSYFGEEFSYIMDAKSTGNLGRYLNHSCSPNVFVQNVFVDTHDLRFPWVAFFAHFYIRAGTELTWDYNYDVGSVPGKILYCYCGSADCRGRLL